MAADQGGLRGHQAKPPTRSGEAPLDEGGIEALRLAPGRGRPAKLDAGQLVAVRAAILRRSTEHGFGTELWTAKRVGVVIERLHGVRFSQAHVWRILGALGFKRAKARETRPGAQRGGRAPLAAQHLAGP
jgi:transposase